MRTLLFFLLLSGGIINAQDSQHVIRLSDPKLKTSKPVARVTISDTTGTILRRGFTNSDGCFSFMTTLDRVLLKVDSTQETCDGIPMPVSKTLNLTKPGDTITIVLGHIWVDIWPLPLEFADGSMLFQSIADSTAAACDFTHPEADCSGFKELDLLLREFNNCGAWKKMEITTYYTFAESKQHGATLALARADSCIAYLKARGMKDVEFVVTPRFYPDRPLKNADGTFRAEEINLVSFRIMGW